MKQKRRKRRLNKNRILLAIVISLTVFVLILSSVLFFIKKADKTVYQKTLLSAEASSLMGKIELPQLRDLTTTEADLLDDYNLVFEMLMKQDMPYNDEVMAKITEAEASVREKLEQKDIENLEVAINTLANVIDEPLEFAGGTGETTVPRLYARGLLILNKEHGASAAFDPGNRVIMMNAFAEMEAAAANEGINLYAFSNYRNYYLQVSLFDRYVAADGEAAANRYSARPGFSEHQSGFVMDIGGDNQAAWAEETFDDTKEAAWLAEHAHEYGFILRYPLGKEELTGYMYESWHFRYVGPIATKITNSGLSLEEYLGLV